MRVTAGCRAGRVRGALAVVLLAACTAGAAPAPAAGPDTAAIAFLEARVRADPDDVVALNMLVDRHLARRATVLSRTAGQSTNDFVAIAAFLSR